MGKYREIGVEEIICFLREGNYKYEVIGCEDIRIAGFSSLNCCKKDTVTWVKKQENWNRDDDAK